VRAELGRTVEAPVSSSITVEFAAHYTSGSASRGISHLPLPTLEDAKQTEVVEMGDG
jgi:hypothetical protein